MNKELIEMFGMVCDNISCLFDANVWRQDKVGSIKSEVEYKRLMRTQKLANDFYNNEDYEALELLNMNLQKEIDLIKEIES